MTWKIKVSTNAEKYYKKLDKRLRQRIKISLIELSVFENPLLHSQVKPLTGELKGFHRLRIGDYRVIFSLIKGNKIIAVVNIVPRGKAY